MFRCHCDDTYLELRINFHFYFVTHRNNLALMKELGDRGAQGRACGNLGNTFYLLGDFEAAIGHHQVSIYYKL